MVTRTAYHGWIVAEPSQAFSLWSSLMPKCTTLTHFWHVSQCEYGSQPQTQINLYKDERCGSG
jgi:hypothetical protein